MYCSRFLQLLAIFVICGDFCVQNLDIAGVKALVTTLNSIDVADVEVVVAPSAIHISEVITTLKKDIAISAQNCNFKVLCSEGSTILNRTNFCTIQQGNGAYTGEISADQLKEFGVSWVILGHSERRQYFKEDNTLLREKLQYALSKGLKVIYCIGETLEQREADQTKIVNISQLEPVKDLLDSSKVVIAYEPIWAIGTGKVATPEQAQETHKDIRDYLASFNADLAANIRIQVLDAYCYRQPAVLLLLTLGFGSMGDQQMLQMLAHSLRART